MNRFRLFSWQWWALHIAALIFFFALGHWVHFPS